MIRVIKYSREYGKKFDECLKGRRKAPSSAFSWQLKMKAKPRQPKYLFRRRAIFKNKIIRCTGKDIPKPPDNPAATALFSSNIVSSVSPQSGGLLVARFLWPEENRSFRAFTIPFNVSDIPAPWHLGRTLAPVPLCRQRNAGEGWRTWPLRRGLVICYRLCLLRVHLLRDIQPGAHEFYGVLAGSLAIFFLGVFYAAILLTYRTLHHFYSARIRWPSQY